MTRRTRVPLFSYVGSNTLKGTNQIQQGCRHPSCNEAAVDCGTDRPNAEDVRGELSRKLRLETSRETVPAGLRHQLVDVEGDRIGFRRRREGRGIPARYL